MRGGRMVAQTWNKNDANLKHFGANMRGLSLRGKPPTHVTTLLSELRF